MSFRIEDILKTEVKKAQNELSCDSKKGADFRPAFATSSILQKTLLTRPNLQYCRSISEPTSSDGCGSWCQNGALCSSRHCYEYDMYKPKDLLYRNLYLRTSQIWPNYRCSPPSFFSHFYHFSKRKGGQVRFTANQTDALEKRFTSHKYLSPEDRKLLADSLKLTDRQVKTWFQNRRAKWRRCNSVSSGEITSTKLEDKHPNATKPNETVKSQN